MQAELDHKLLLAGHPRQGWRDDGDPSRSREEMLQPTDYGQHNGAGTAAFGPDGALLDPDGVRCALYCHLGHCTPDITSRVPGAQCNVSAPLASGLFSAVASPPPHQGDGDGGTARAAAKLPKHRWPPSFAAYATLNSVRGAGRRH